MTVVLPTLPHLPVVGIDASLFTVANVAASNGSVSTTPIDLLAFFKKMDLDLERVETRTDAIKDAGEAYRPIKFKGTITASGIVGGVNTTSNAGVTWTPGTTQDSSWMESWSAGAYGLLYWTDSATGGMYCALVFNKGIKRAVSENATEDTLTMLVQGTLSYAPSGGTLGPVNFE